MVDRYIKEVKDKNKTIKKALNIEINDENKINLNWRMKEFEN